MSHKYPDFSLIHATPNGGKRHISVAVKLKREGVKAGFPDVSIPVPRGIYHGAYIEMKKEKGGRVSPEQKWWIEKLQEQGYAVAVCNGFNQAQDFILQYFSINADT